MNGSAVRSAPNLAADAASLAAQQAAGAAKQTQDSLARAARAVQDIQAMQAAARGAAQARQTSITAPVVVPNGLGAGGLQVAPGAAPGSALWRGANAPTQSVDAAGQTQVGIQQTSARAILNWSSFNVGARTTLTFDQQGNATWVALNRVAGATAPSQILGNIKADGQVYVINQNGIIFGGGSQINVGSLIASSAAITDSQFLDSGIYSTRSGSSYAPSFTGAGGKIVVENGALITTNAASLVTSGGGFVLMMGSQVDNAGTIATPKGQALLAAGDAFILRPGFGTNSNQASTTRGHELAPVIAVGSASGVVSNSGLIFAQQGDITLAGRTLAQNGVLIATTSVNTRGTVHLLNAASDAAGSVTLGATSLTTVLPELDSNETALDSQRDALIAASTAANALRGVSSAGQFDNLSLLADRQDQSRIEIVSGGTVTFKGGSVTAAQGGQIAVSANKRIFAEDGAMLDVSGVRGVALAMASNNIKINVQGNELRDSPQNRDSSLLKNNDVWIDARDLTLVPAGTGGYASDRYYTAGGLLEVGGYLGTSAHTIGEWSALGGSITLSAPEVIAQRGAAFDISGGSLDYAGGYIRSTNLLGSDGRTYSVDNAPADMTFTGFAGGFSRKHSIQGKVDDRLTETWSSMFGRGRTSVRWEDGYTVGRDAGRLILSTPTSIFEADIVADTVTGQRQTNKRPDGASDGYKLTQTTAALNGQLMVGRYGVVTGDGIFNSDIRFGDAAAITAGRSDTDVLPSARTGTVWFNTSHINAMGLGGLDIGTSDTITIERALMLADGGQIRLIAPVVDIKADITARSGSLTVDNYFKGGGDRGNAVVLLKNGTSSVALHEGVTLDLRGVWVNALLNKDDTRKLAYLDGGTVRLQSTHDVTLKADSLIDVSSGGAILANAKVKGGRGGDVSLIADQENSQVQPDGLLTLNGNIRGYGVSGGGTLKIESGTAIGTGGKLLATDGVLGAGEKAPADLVLLQDFQVKAGDVLPVDYSYKTSIAKPGEMLGTSNLGINDVTLGADWIPPRPGGGSVGYVILTNIGVYRIGPDAALPVIPAGTIINSIPQGSLPSSFVVPGDVFPNGIRIFEKTVTIAAGAVSPVDFTIAQGTRLAAGTVFTSAVTVAPTMTVDTSLFQSGFSRYDVNGRHGLVVAGGARLDVTMPVYRFTDTASTTATGADPANALNAWTPPEWTEDSVNNRLIQRGGASLTLRSTIGEAGLMAATGPIDVREGVAISVDAGQSISLQGTDFTINGTLTAPSGTISLTGNSAATNKAGLIWIGDHAVLDVAARAVTATNASGRTYGVVANGGSILIGGAMDWEAKGEAAAPHAFVVIRPGAVLDASGTGAVLDIPAPGLGANSTPFNIASDGGTIVVKSSIGLYLDGTLRAASGGANAAGGTLALALATPAYPTLTTTGDVLRHREFVIADIQGDSSIAGAASMAEGKAGLVVGTARLGVDRIHEGGFGNLSLLADGPLSFDGNVTLAMSQSLRLYAGTFALGESAGANSQVSLSAPYVRLAGTTRLAGDGFTLPAVTWGSGPSQQASDAVFSVTADLIDLRDRVGFGARKLIDTKTSIYTVDRRSFALVDLTSRGDIRLLAGLPGRGIGSSALTTELATTGDITLVAAQIYPASGVGAQIVAGYQEIDNFLSGSVLTIRRYGDTVPDVPYSAFGLLYLGAETVNQGGVVRAPFGALQLGTMGRGDPAQADAINLLPGSITSVSGAGLVMPYGGTIDGLDYRYNGSTIVLDGAGGMTGTDLKRGIRLSTTHLNVESGAVLDLAGGGELTGAGFVSGRGGSVDILTTPLINSNPGYSYSSKGNAVYAIVPSRAAAYAPVVQEAGYGAPLTGQQITIPKGVPGLAAGTYMLMPSSYALLPGAFRVEIGASNQTNLASATAIGNGSYVATATLGIANTSIRASLPNLVTITPADTVRKHSSYNEMGYNAFVLADAARLGVPRAMLTVDAKTLDILMGRPAVADGRSQLRFNGDLRMDPASGSGGFGGTVNVRRLGEILAPGQSADPAIRFASVYADELSKLDAPRLVLNGTITTVYGVAGRFATILGGYGNNLILRSGARIAAAEVILASNGEAGFITIEEGASISTVGRGRASYDSSDGFVFIAEGGVVALSNGFVNLLQTSATNSASRVNITVGGCVTVDCNRTTTLVSEGTIAVSTSGAFNIANNVSYGTRNLVLGLSAINLGEDASLAAAAASGHLPAGLSLNQGLLAQLLAGNTATGAPALETLVLNARDAVNIFGAVTLDASKVGRLVLGTPTIYGYGAAGDTATIRAGEFIWTGSAAAPGAAMTAILGDGKLDIAAKRVVFGYGPNSQPSSTVVDNRLALGFATVNIAASERITSNGKGTLGVYHQQGAYVPATGYQYTGGDLTFTAPLLTGAAGSVNTITAGGDVLVTGAGSAAVPHVDALGAQLKLTGTNVTVDTSVVLPSGKLVLTATGDILLGGAARIDLSGRAVEMFDVTKYSWGGDLVLTSSAGNIRQATGSVIDLSARYNRGGTMTVTALGAGAGHVDLGGTVLGSASGQYDAGGTMVPYDAAELTVRAQTLADFAGLNARLNSGAVVGARRFQIKQGSLTVGDEVQAGDVEIAVDGGNLTVNGTINASGFQVGSIRLAAMGDLTINGTLDAHGTGLRVDSYGKIIDSPNRAIVDLTTRLGTLTLSSNAAIDLRAGTGVTHGNGPGQNDGAARGTLNLNAPRLGGSGIPSGERGVNGANDVAVNVLGTPQIHGAKTVAVNAFRIYDDAPLASAPDVTGHKPQEITQGYLDDIDQDSSAFINAALANTALASKLSGLGSYHLRPGVEVVSKISTENPNGDLAVAGDLDLSGYRYGPQSNRLDPALRGFGEPGVLTIRAAGDLNIRGSINDGFAPPSATFDDKGWQLGPGVVPYGGDLVLPIAVTLEAGTTFRKGVTLNYDLPATFDTLVRNPQGNNVLAGTVLPVRATLAGPLNLSAGSVVGATIYNADGTVAYAAGTVLPNAVTLTAGMQLGAGTVLRSDAKIAALIWPKGIPLPGNMTSSGPLSLATGSLIPSMTNVKLAGDQPIELRPVVNGVQGRNWAVAPMLGAGATAWSMSLVAGADLGSADRRALNPASTGAITLGDTHYISGPGPAQKLWDPNNWWGMPPNDPVPDDCLWACLDPGQCYDGAPGAPAPVAPSFSVVRTGTGDLDLVAAGDIRMNSLYGIYTAGTATSVDPTYNRARGLLADGTLLGPRTADYAAPLSTYQAWYPDQGGNVLIAAGGDLVGDITQGTGPASVITGNWLWRQGTGSTAVDATIPTSWWINFGTYTANTASGAPGNPDLLGFTGIGALGGGDVAIRVGGSAGTIALRGEQATDGGHRSQGLVVAVGSTGRVGADGSLTLTGGGDVDMRIAGALNPNLALTNRQEIQVLPGALVNLRGALHVAAESIGGIKLIYRSGASGFNDAFDPRGIDPFTATSSDARSGITLVPGDSAVYLETLGDLVLGGAGDPGRSKSPNRSAFSAGGSNDTGQSWFSLWTGHTAINLISAGGNLTPSTSASENRAQTSDQIAADGSFIYPSIFRAAALGGSMYYGVNALSYMRGDASEIYPFITLAPSPHGSLEMLARDSIYGGQYSFSLSSSGVALPTPFNPAFMGDGVDPLGHVKVTNGSGGVIDLGGNPVALSLFFFGPNTAAFDIGRASSADPIRFYAREGDVVGLRTGETLSFSADGSTWYSAAAPIMVRAGRDIVGAGLAPGVALTSALQGATSRGNLIVHSDPNDVSIVSAGRDIVYANFDIAGPGTLEVSAARNLYQADKGAITSIGPIVPGDTRPGASILLQAGVGPDGPDYAALVKLYLDPARMADPAEPLGQQPGKVMQTADTIASPRDLYAWVKTQAGYTGDEAGALAFFNSLPADKRAAYPTNPLLFTWLKDRGYKGTQGDALAYFLGQSADQRNQFTYNAMLYAWLQTQYGYSGNQAGALTFFNALPMVEQSVFSRIVYFAELTASGREYNNPDSLRYGSYLRGRQMIATLFPERDADNNPILRSGDITMFGGSGVRTNFGGDIQMLTPGGRTIIGVEGQVPPASSGLITQGKGDIQLYSKGSILLGLSRIMTTYGGGILAWSEEGDINAGRGSKTTVLYTPPKRVYDDYGNVTVSPQAPSSGAGIATLNPLAGIPPGNIDLIAPIGTIDAGEAGIRVSGNVNLAALQILNAANIQVQGTSSGIPTVQAPNISAALSASNATAATQQTALPAPVSGNSQPSVIIVEFLGFGGGAASPDTIEEDERSRRRDDRHSQNPTSPVQVIGAGTLEQNAISQLTPDERKRLVQ
ncbi:filamentous hemagglutinin family protein [Bradyrhizobium sp. 31Argb]